MTLELLPCFSRHFVAVMNALVQANVYFGRLRIVSILNEFSQNLQTKPVPNLLISNAALSNFSSILFSRQVVDKSSRNPNSNAKQYLYCSKMCRMNDVI